jgi:Domain of unknown function (DUF1707)
MPEDDGPVTEPEQEELLRALQRHVASGRLELAEFDVRAAQLYRATTRATARAVLDGLPLLDAGTPSGRRARRRHGEGAPVQEHWVATGEVFRDPTSGRVMRVWVDPTDGSRHYAPTER